MPIKKRTAILLGLFLAPWLVFFRVANYDFVSFDDGLHIYRNAYLNPPSVKKLPELWKAPYQGLYIPLTYTAWMLEASLVKQRAGGVFGTLSPYLFHVGNLLVHCANVALVFLLFSELGLAWAPALLGCLLFAWHPLQVEPVAWISSLKDLLAGTFVLFALWQYVRFAKSGMRRYYVAAIVAFGLGTLAKPAALVFPLLAGILDIGVLKRPWRKSIPAWAPWLLVGIPLGFLTKGQQPDVVMEFVTPWQWRPVVAADALTFYLSKVLFPFFLTLNYGRPPELVLANPGTYVACLVPLGVIWFLFRQKNRAQWLTAAALFVAYLLPVLGLVPFYFQRYSTVADRYVYLAMLGPALAIAWWLGAAQTSRARYAIVAMVLVLLAVRSHDQLKIWEDYRTMVRSVISINPRDPEVHYSMAVLLAEESLSLDSATFDPQVRKLPRAKQEDAHRQQREARAVHHFQEAIRLNPKHVFAYNNLGALLHRMHKPALAETYLRKAVAIDPEMQAAQNNLGVALADQAKFSEAVEVFARAVKLAPSDTKAHMNLGMALEAGKASADARAHFFRALEINADNDEARLRLADNLAKDGLFAEAMGHYETLVRRSPVVDLELKQKLAQARAKARAGVPRWAPTIH